MSAHTLSNTHTCGSRTAGTARHVRTQSAVAPFPPRPAFRPGLMSNLRKLAIAGQRTAENVNLAITYARNSASALKDEGLKKEKSACNYNKLQTKPSCFSLEEPPLSGAGDRTCFCSRIFDSWCLKHHKSHRTETWYESSPEKQLKNECYNS